MNYITLIGLMAATLTTASFIPQIIKIMQTKSTKDISLVMFLSYSLGIICWLIYGLFINSFPVIAANAMTLILNIIILGYKLKYK